MAKQPSGATNSNTVMSPTAQTGVFNFSQGSVNLLTDIAGPGGLPSAVNSDVGTIFSNISSSLSAGSVTPNSDANLVDVHWGYPTPLTQYFPTVRIDYNMRENLRHFLSWNMTKTSQQNGDVPPLPGSYYSKFGGTNNFKYFTLAYGLDWTVTKSLLNSFRAGYLYNSATYGYDLTPAWKGDRCSRLAGGLPSNHQTALTRSRRKETSSGYAQWRTLERFFARAGGCKPPLGSTGQDLGRGIILTKLIDEIRAGRALSTSED